MSHGAISPSLMVLYFFGLRRKLLANVKWGEKTIKASIFTFTHPAANPPTLKIMEFLQQAKSLLVHAFFDTLAVVGCWMLVKMSADNSDYDWFNCNDH